jgi:hypothetical protein
MGFSPSFFLLSGPEESKWGRRLEALACNSEFAVKIVPFRVEIFVKLGKEGVVLWPISNFRRCQIGRGKADFNVYRY